MGLTFLLGGQDITNYVDEMSIQLSDTLGQGAGTSAVSSGRASTIQFKTTLGPIMSALGAGSSPGVPALLRGAEIQVSDTSNTCIFGGYLTKADDNTEKKQIYTTCYGYDYYAELDRIQVQQYYSGRSDVYMIRDLFSTYAPWVDLSLLPATGSYQFTVKVFKAVSLQKALNAITDITGWIAWIDTSKRLRYINPASSSSAPYSVSDAPNYITSFPAAYETLTVDDTAAVNRVVFYGGKKLSNDFTQDLSTQANGSNKVFVLAYYPHAASDGTIHIQANGSGDLAYGYEAGSGDEDKLKSAGGTADVLLNTDAHTLTFDVAPTNAGPNSVTARYRYDYPMVVQVTDQASRNFFGRYFDAPLNDESVLDVPTAVARCRTLLAEQGMGLTTLKLNIWNKPGLKAGQILKVKDSVRGVDGSYLIQQVDTVPLGAGKFKYNVSCGAWSWNVVDVLLDAIHAAFKAGLEPVDDNANGVQTNAIKVQQLSDLLAVTSSVSVQERTTGAYYARSTPLGDGHDAYCGLFTV